MATLIASAAPAYASGARCPYTSTNVEVDVGGREGGRLAEAKAEAVQDVDERLVVGGDAGVEARVFVGCEESHFTHGCVFGQGDALGDVSGDDAVDWASHGMGAAR